MRSPSLDTVRLIDDPAALPALSSTLGRERRLALDSESDSFHHYEEQGCLLQIATPTQTVLLDLIKLDHVNPLLPLFADPAIEKVLHGADYDVRILGRDYGIAFTHLFDTMIAAQLLGFDAFGLGALVHQHFGVTLNKRYQKADWTQRPLPPEMIRYAAEDTAYLLPLSDILARALEEQGRLAWLREECERLTGMEAGERPAPSCFAVKGAGRLTPPQLAVLQALLEARDELARAADRAPFRIIAPDVLLELAQRQPENPDALSAVKGLSRRLINEEGARLLDTIRRARALPPDRWPTRPRTPYTPLTQTQEERLRRLKAVRQRHAERLKLNPGLLCSNSVMEGLIRLESPDAEAVASRLMPWRTSILEEEFLSILSAVNPARARSRRADGSPSPH
ncbi:MAG TPA: HRDC domain-containing protein [Nitrospiria bacterium]|nr:HRDC domain-containing protein [Nitrospiria bacterium]